MHNIKKILAVLLAIMMISALAACVNNDPDVPGKDPNGVTDPSNPGTNDPDDPDDPDDPSDPDDPDDPSDPGTDDPDAPVAPITVNGVATAWEKLNLPSSFPKLANGVDKYTRLSDGFVMEWKTLTSSQISTIVKLLEEAADTDAIADKNDALGINAWYILGDGYTVEVRQYTKNTEHINAVEVVYVG